MQLKIRISMDNAAFEGCNGAEAARILRSVAETIEDVELSERSTLALADVNGNVVGRLAVEE